MGLLLSSRHCNKCVADCTLLQLREGGQSDERKTEGAPQFLITRNQFLLILQIAVEGCCHGELDAIYKAITSFEVKHNTKVDLLIICGDFQAIRAHEDFDSIAVPHKFRQLGFAHHRPLFLMLKNIS